MGFDEELIGIASHTIKEIGTTITEHTTHFFLRERGGTDSVGDIFVLGIQARTLENTHLQLPTVRVAGVRFLHIHWQISQVRRECSKLRICFPFRRDVTSRLGASEKLRDLLDLSREELSLAFLQAI